MLNPLRSEAAAFRFLIGLLVYFALIVAAKALAGAAAATIVFGALTAAALWWALRN
ncbi:MAG: hypothetical protein H0V40_09320 [Actinobacteria bacterium]|nr:hypothetical protein [Actinomycetota bacterium]